MENKIPPPLEHLIIEYPIYRKSWERIREVHTLLVDQGVKKCLPIYGVSGVGKTSLLLAYRAAYEKYDVPGGTIVPALYATLPSKPTSAGLIASLLKGIGDPAYDQGPLKQCKKRLHKLIKDCRVEIILLDEVQHLLDRGRLKTHTAIADLIKEIIDESNAAFILAGAPRSRTLFQVNTQLRGRASGSIFLRPFDIEDTESARHFVEILNHFVGAMQIKNPDFLLDLDLLRRLFCATDGVLRNISKLLGCAQRLLDKDRILTMPILQRAFRDEIWSASEEPSNPFSKGFQFRRLTQPGEPFEASELDGDNHDPH